MSILCARLGTRLLAAHPVVLDLDALVYMVPAGISYATVVRVGQSAGRQSLLQVARSARASMMLAMGYITIAATLFAGFAHFWGGLYTNDATVVAAAVPIFIICAFLQFGDAAGVIYTSALTGLGDTRTPMLISTAWYWLLGMPLSYWLTFSPLCLCAGFGWVALSLQLVPQFTWTLYGTRACERHRHALLSSPCYRRYPMSAHSR